MQATTYMYSRGAASAVQCYEISAAHVDNQVTMSSLYMHAWERDLSGAPPPVGKSLQAQ